MSVFNNQVVVITGGSDGIGKALVEQFLAMGARVATCGRSQDKLNQLQVQHPGASLFLKGVDVRNELECEQFIADVISTWGQIDVLINNAGISMRALITETTTETLKQVMDINFWGTVYTTKAALPAILKQKGVIVGVSSIAGYRGLPGRSGYSASNKDAKSQGQSPMDEGIMMSSEECAGHIIHAIEKRKRTLVLTFTGKRAVFMNKFFPGLADKLTFNFFFKNGQLIK